MDNYSRDLEVLKDKHKVKVIRTPKAVMKAQLVAWDVITDKLSAEDRKAAMKEIRESEWFNLAAEKGESIQVKDSPHSIFGRNT